MKHIEQAEVVRERWGRPIIGGVAYSRASSDVLSDKSNLIGWARRSETPPVGARSPFAT